MLAISRTPDEQDIRNTICIGDDIEVTVVKFGNNKVRLGINAPNHIAVHRKEIKQRIDAGHIMPRVVAEACTDGGSVTCPHPIEIDPGNGDASHV